MKGVKNLIIGFDPDAKKESISLFKQYKYFFQNVYIIKYSGFKDPSSANDIQLMKTLTNDIMNVDRYHYNALNRFKLKYWLAISKN